MAVVDHLVYGVPDLADGCDDMERRLGVRPAPGGRHAGLGTANALVAIGGDLCQGYLFARPEKPWTEIKF